MIHQIITPQRNTHTPRMRILWHLLTTHTNVSTRRYEHPRAILSTNNTRPCRNPQSTMMTSIVIMYYSSRANGPDFSSLILYEYISVLPCLASIRNQRITSQTDKNQSTNNNATDEEHTHAKNDIHRTVSSTSTTEPPPRCNVSITTERILAALLSW